MESEELFLRINDMMNQHRETMTSTLSEADIISDILQLKQKLNAVILAHYYQYSEIQDLADFIGDSLELARKAQQTTADVIVFCGVHFMAETAKILNPNKLVLLPDLKAGCSLADSAPTNKFREFRESHPDHIVISYINCTADVKALSDIICTSSNAEFIIRSLPENQPIIFAPDKNLGSYLMKKTGREMLLWQGACIVHETFSEKKIEMQLLEHPEAELIAHPECEEPLLRRAHFIGSTSALLRYSAESDKQTFIVATEAGILHQMERRSPHKTFIPALPYANNCSCNECPYMKMNTLEKLYLCMKNQTPEITMDEDTRLRALKPLERMLEISSKMNT